MSAISTREIRTLQGVTLMLLIGHTYMNGGASDQITLGLLAFLIGAPILANVTRLRHGDTEVVISDEEAQEIEEGTESLPERDLEPDPYEKFYEHLYAIGQYNVAAAILTLKIEVERVVREIYYLATDEDPDKIPLGQLLKQLKDEGNITDDSYVAIRPFVMTFNKISHGQQIILEDENDFEVIVLSGIKLLKYFYTLKEELLEN